MNTIKQLTREEAEALMADIGYSKHSDCRYLVETAFGMGVSRTLEAMKPVTVHLKTGNSKFDGPWEKIEHFNRATQLKHVYEWVKTGHINLAEFSGLIGRLQ